MQPRTAATLTGLALATAGCGASPHRHAVRAPVRPTSTSRPMLVAKMTGAVLRKARRFGLPTITLRFTIGARGGPPGSGFPHGSVFSVLVSNKAGVGETFLAKGYGKNGHFTATTFVPPGGIGSIQIGGFLDVPTGSSSANGDYWIPISYAAPPH